MELTQQEVREKLIQKSKAFKIKYIAEQIKVPREMLSRFKTCKRDLWPESLEALNNFLENN